MKEIEVTTGGAAAITWDCVTNPSLPVAQQQAFGSSPIYNIPKKGIFYYAPISERCPFTYLPPKQRGQCSRKVSWEDTAPSEAAGISLISLLQSTLLPACWERSGWTQGAVCLYTCKTKHSPSARWKKRWTYRHLQQGHKKLKVRAKQSQKAFKNKEM